MMLIVMHARLERIEFTTSHGNLKVLVEGKASRFPVMWRQSASAADVYLSDFPTFNQAIEYAEGQARTLGCDVVDATLETSPG